MLPSIDSRAEGREPRLPGSASRGNKVLFSVTEQAEKGFSLMQGERGFCITQSQPRVTACGRSEPQREGKRASGAWPEWISQ